MMKPTDQIADPTWADIYDRDNRIAELEQDLALLNALRRAGVDNWEGYEFALDELEAPE